MTIKIISGTVLTVLSSLSAAADTLPGGASPAGRDKGAQSAPVTAAPAALPAQQATSPAVRRPGLTLSLREHHLLSQDVSAWAKTQGMHPLWNSSRDYIIHSTIHLNGENRDDVLDQLGQLFQSENYGLVIRLYEKNHVLVIDSQ